MSATPVDATFARASVADARAAASLEALAANAQARSEIRREVDKRELRMAGRDLIAGLRGVVRASPLASVMAGVAIGVFLSGRSRKRRA